MLPSFLAKTREEAAKAAEKLGFPVVLKIVSRDIQHKWDVGGVKLGLMNDGEVLRAFDEITKNAREVTTAIEGVLVLPMVPVSGKVECLASVVRDSVFGPVLVFGLGGVFTEVLRDISVRVLPVTKDHVKDMIREIKGYPVLKGARGIKPRDIGALEKMLFTLSRIALDYPEIHEIELNPVIVHRKGVSVVDTLVSLEEDQ
jgi:acyl-CoA synthetase (NDP forming)